MRVERGLPQGDNFLIDGGDKSRSVDLDQRMGVGQNPLLRKIRERGGGGGGADDEAEMAWREASAENRLRMEQERRTMAPYTWLASEVLLPLVLKNDEGVDKKTESEISAEAEKAVERVSLHLMAGMYGLENATVLVNRSPGYSEMGGLDQTAKQLREIAQGNLASENRWLDTSENGRKIRAQIAREAKVLDAEGTVLAMEGIFAKEHYGWDAVLMALKSRSRTGNEDPESAEFAWVITRGLRNSRVMAMVSRLTEEPKPVDSSGRIDCVVEGPKSEEKLMREIDGAHRWYTAIAAVSQEDYPNNPIRRVMNGKDPKLERLIKDVLTMKSFSSKRESNGQVIITEQSEVGNIFSMKQDERAWQTRRFVRACLSLDVWNRMGGNVSDSDYVAILSSVRARMQEMNDPNKVSLEGSIRDSYLVEGRAESMSLGLMRNFGLGGLLGASVVTEREYTVSSTPTPKIIYDGQNRPVYLVQRGVEKKSLSGGDTRASGGDWDSVRYPLVFLANTAYKAWNEGRIGILQSEIDGIRNIVSKAPFDRDHPDLQKVIYGLPSNLVTSFMEHSMVTVNGEKKSMWDVFLDGTPLYNLPWEAMRTNELYKWMIQLSQAKILFDVLFAVDAADGKEMAYTKYVASLEGLNELTKRVALATDHDKDKSEVWMAGLVFMMFSRQTGLTDPRSVRQDKKATFEAVCDGVKNLNWKGDKAWGERIAARIKSMYDAEIKRWEKSRKESGK